MVTSVPYSTRVFSNHQGSLHFPVPVGCSCDHNHCFSCRNNACWLDIRTVLTIQILYLQSVIKGYRHRSPNGPIGSIQRLNYFANHSVGDILGSQNNSDTGSIEWLRTDCVFNNCSPIGRKLGFGSVLLPCLHQSFKTPLLFISFFASIICFSISAAASGVSLKLINPIMTEPAA